ncbi:HD domain-containing protein [Streptomyces sp. NPDC059443]|uniref:HD domain-containing protein n=1 Tax=unclassified Streptomyces TaxID=2593676 RepID=UPI0036B8AE5F
MESLRVRQTIRLRSLVVMRNPGREPDQTLWGKARGLDEALPPYPVVRHLLDAAAIGPFLWDWYLSENQCSSIAAGFGLGGESERARALVGLCAGLHDIGKISGFQFCDRRAAGYMSGELVGDLGAIGAERIGHDVAGMRSAPAVLAALGFGEGPGEDSAVEAIERIAEVIGGHHGRFHRFEDLYAGAVYQDLLGGAAWAEQRAVHAAAVFGSVGAPLPPADFRPDAAVLVTGVVILADWLVSQEGYVKLRQRSLGPSLDRHFAQSCADSERLVREAGLLPVKLARGGFSKAYGIDGEPNALQRSLTSGLATALAKSRRESGCPDGRAGILVVTAAPGDGKTEAALEAERVLSEALGTSGFAFLLPTMATSDQMHGRVAGVLARQSGVGAGLTLTHSMAWLSPAYGEDEPVEGERVLVCDGDGDEEGDRTGPARHQADMRPTRWLRGEGHYVRYDLSAINNSRRAFETASAGCPRWLRTS